MLWPQKPRFYIANNYLMDDLLQKIVAASEPFLSRVLLCYVSFTPEDAGRRKDIRATDKNLIVWVFYPQYLKHLGEEI